MSMASEAYDEAYDESYDEAYDEGYDEAVRPSRLSLARPNAPLARPTDRPVTQAQLQMAIESVNKGLRTNSAAIATVNRTVSRIGRDVTQTRRSATSTRKDISTLRDAVVIGPLLAGTLGGGNPLLSAMVPMMLVSSVGTEQNAGVPNSGPGMFGGGDQMMTMFMLLGLSGGLGGKAVG